MVENTFGIMASRFRMFKRLIIAKVEMVRRETMAAVPLHNYLMKSKPTVIRVTGIAQPVMWTLTHPQERSQEIGETK